MTIVDVLTTLLGTGIVLPKDKPVAPVGEIAVVSIHPYAETILRIKGITLHVGLTEGTDPPAGTSFTEGIWTRLR